MITANARHFLSTQSANRLLARAAIVAAAGAIALSFGGAACAADATASPAAMHPVLPDPVLTEKTLVVKLDDLDLATDAGTSVANERIRIAAHKACDYTTAAGDYVVGRQQVFVACLDRTMAAADGQLEKLRLAALLHSGAKVAGNEVAEPASPAPKASGSP
jgi:UrcA family protein